MSDVSPYLKPVGAKGFSPKSYSAVKPYDLWRQQLVTRADQDALQAARKFSQAKDFSDVSHLTKGQGITAHVDYVSAQNIYFGKEDVKKEEKHKAIDDAIIKVMKKTTYTIGKQGDDAPNEKKTSTGNTHVKVPNTLRYEEGYDKNSRRAAPDNPNRVLTVGFGAGTEKGTYEH